MAFVKALSSAELPLDLRIKSRRVTAGRGRALSAMLSVRDVALAGALATTKVTPALAEELQSRPALRKELRRAIAKSSQSSV